MSMTRATKRARELLERPGYPADPRVEAVLTAARLNLSVRRTAALARVPKSTLDTWLNQEDDEGTPRYPEFVAEYAWRQAEPLEGISIAALEGALEDPKLALEVLARLDPERWKPVARQEQTGEGGGPVKTEQAISLPAGWSREAIAEQAEQLRKAREGGADE